MVVVVLVCRVSLPLMQRSCAHVAHRGLIAAASTPTDPLRAGAAEKSVSLAGMSSHRDCDTAVSYIALKAGLLLL
jgi:hypothetical protein